MFFKVISDRLNLKIKTRDKEKYIYLLDRFEQIFREYNTHTNLMSKGDLDKFYSRHVFDSLSLNLFLCKYKLKLKQLKLLDIGSGGGFPSIILAIFFDNLDIIATDSILKKTKFIDKVIFDLRLKNLTVKTTRCENLESDLRDYFDIITSRAVAPLNVILEYGIPFLKEGGFFVSYKGKGYREEIARARNALKVLNCEVVDVLKYELPMQQEYIKNNLVIVKKVGSSCICYPRETNLINKKPL